MTSNKIVKWIDAGREPREKPNPDFPEGIDLDISDGGTSCFVRLPYPAKRCGHYVVECQCGMRIIVTTAGRPDDPRSVKIACRT